MNFQLRMTTIFAVYLLFVISISAQTIYTIPSGTQFRVRMDNEINSRISIVNDTFIVTLPEAFLVRGVEILPAKTTLEGRVIKVRRAATGGKNGSFEIRFETLRLPNGVRREIEAVPVGLEEYKSSNAKSVLTILGGTAIGAVIGGVINKSSGALIGAGVGAGTGAGAIFLQKGKEARIKTDEEIAVRLTKEVTLPAEDY